MGAPPEWLIELWDLAKLAGPFATLLMSLLWWLERQERLAAQTSQLKAVEVLERNAQIAATWVAQMEGRNRATETLAAAVDRHSVVLEMLTKSLDEVKRLVGGG